MGRYLRKCKKVVGEIAVVGVKTRAARAALAIAEAASATSSPAKKIKKVSKSSPSTAYPTSVPQLRNRRKNLSAPAVVVEEDVKNCSSSEVITNIRSDFPASCSSSNNDDHSSSIVPEIVKNVCLTTSSADLEVEESGEASSKELERDRTEARDASTKSDQDHSQATKSTVDMKMPADSEIEEFFSAAEKDLQKHFSNKYNYDIGKDVPLKGRYDWVAIKP